MKRIVALLLLTIFYSCADRDYALHQEDLLAYVNPFVGSDGPGNTYPGAQYPFGAVQLSPDHGLSGWDRISGYSWSDTIISGFSHLHLSGTGAGDLYDILFMPTNEFSNRRLRENGNRPYSVFSHEQEGASPGYYWVYLKDFNIKAELCAGQRGAIQRYSFPESKEKAINLDLGYALNWDTPVETYIEVINNKKIRGYRKSTGWAADQRVYFLAEFSKEFDSYKLYKSDTLQQSFALGKNTKAVFNFDQSDSLNLEIKVSLASSGFDGVEKNFDLELRNTNFEQLRKSTQSRWNQELNKILIESENLEIKKTFYTCFYQSMLNPRIYSDLNGEYKSPNGLNSKADDFVRYDLFSLWDTFRAAHPLLTIVQPERTVDMMKSLMAHYYEYGLLPVWELQGNESNMMMGYHAVPVIVDAYFKGLTGDINSDSIFAACKKSAMQNKHNIDLYREKGFVPSDGSSDNWSVSKTLEYSYDDWCIAKLAEALGKNEERKLFAKRAESWKNHFDSKSSFLRPLNSNGEFIENFSPKEYSNDYCESNAWQYFWSVPHNINGLINFLGREKFEQKLDSMFNYYPNPEDKLPIFSTGMIGQYAHGNEPSHHVGYLYNYIGKSYKTQEIVHKIAKSQYSSKADGLCGNEDCGQMSSWYVFSALGFYPVNPASGEYVFGSPLVDGARIRVGEKEFVIEVIRNHENDIYVDEIRLTGQSLKKSFITHKQLLEGGTLTFIMASKPNKGLWNEQDSYPQSMEKMIKD